MLGRKDLMQFNLSYGNKIGYLTDPYKILSVVDDTTGVPNSYFYEKRAELTSTTIGLKYGWLMGKDSEMGVRAEYITQQATASRIIGVQSSQDLLPDVNALLFQINYSSKF